MTHEDMERAIEFLLQHQAKTDAQLAQLSAVTAENIHNIAQLTSNVDQLTSTVDHLASDVGQLTSDVREIVGAYGELRDDVNRLVDIVENTHDFAIQIARLADATEKRVTRLEGENR